MKFTNYRYVVLKQVINDSILNYFSDSMIKIDAKKEVLIVFAFVIFSAKIGLFFIDRLFSHLQKEKMQYHSIVYDERGRKVKQCYKEHSFYQFPNMANFKAILLQTFWLSGTILLKPKSSEKPKHFVWLLSHYMEKKVATVYYRFQIKG